ncbi:VWA domain-containing protein [Kocuria sp. NPDC057446]|uniref:VWA domain-containing protein n=1 Tax=Kocuria sp. NPDC057446 TaxID=3346137 RepID=UPI0036A8D922
MLLTVCAGGDAAEPGKATTSSAPPSSAPPSPAPPSAAGTETGPGVVAHGLAEVPFEDAPRELTDLERPLLVEPGPHAGDGTDDEVLTAARERDPRTAEEWSAAIPAEIHGDYAEDVKTVVRFDPDTGDRGAEPTDAGPAGSRSVGTNHFALVLDASDSMSGDSGDGTRMDAARTALTGFVEELPGGSTVSLRLDVHAGDATEAGQRESCTTTEVVHSGGADAAEPGDVLAGVRPTGWTPLARAVEEAAADFPDGATDGATDGIVHVVTDGVETRGGDPVAAAERLSESGVEPVVNVIGFQAGDADQRALADIAAAGRGEYTRTGSRAEPVAYWREQNTAMARAWNEWRNTELREINEAGNANKRLADEVGNRVKRTADEEASQGKRVANMLGPDVDEQVRREVWDFFDERGATVRDWGDRTHLANWDAADDRHQQDRQTVHDRGEAKWSEYYERLQ